MIRISFHLFRVLEMECIHFMKCSITLNALLYKITVAKLNSLTITSCTDEFEYKCVSQNEKLPIKERHLCIL